MICLFPGKVKKIFKVKVNALAFGCLRCKTPAVEYARSPTLCPSSYFKYRERNSSGTSFPCADAICKNSLHFIRLQIRNCFPDRKIKNSKTIIHFLRPLWPRVINSRKVFAKCRISTYTLIESWYKWQIFIVRTPTPSLFAAKYLKMRQNENIKTVFFSNKIYGMKSLPLPISHIAI